MRLQDYQGTVFGNLRIPCHVYVEGTFGFNDVLCYYDERELQLPEDILVYKEKLVKKRREEAEARGAPFFNGRMVRLKDYGVKIEDPQTEKQKLILIFGPTSWFTYSSTNRSLDEKFLEDERGRRVSIREKYIKDPLDLNDVLANPIGVNTTVISESDGRLLMVERSTKLSQYPGLYGVAVAGFMDRDKDVIEGVPNPFKTLKREAKEEAGIECSLEDFELLGVGRAMDDLHVEILGELRTRLTIQQILSTPKRDKYETLRFIDVPFEPKEVLRYVSKTIDQVPAGVLSESGVWVIGRSPKWVPAHAVNTIYSSIKEYGHEKVLRTLEELYDE